MKSLVNEKNLFEEQKLPRFIAIEGPIGVGKTTLAKRLASSFDYEVLLEADDENPFLERFYQNPRQAAFPTQLYFLFQRSQQIQKLRQADLFQPVTVADFMMEKDRLFAHINLDPDELLLYEKVYEHMTINTPTPDLVIYLQAPTKQLLQRIRKRGLLYERAIEKDYLEQLNDVYMNFFHNYNKTNLLIVNTSEVNFAENDDDYQQLVNYISNVPSGRHYFNPSV